MTWNRVLIVKLPELHADVKQLEAFRAYVCDALGAVKVVEGTCPNRAKPRSLRCPTSPRRRA